MQAARLLPGERLVLDGTLNHPAWQRAPVFDQFVEKAPVYGAVPPQRTLVQVLFDDQALYVGVTALDSEPQRIRDPIVRQDQVNRTQDFVAVYIDAIGSRRAAQWFRASAAGSMADGLHTANDDNEDFSPDFDWDAKVTRHGQGYTAVFRLPFASLRYTPGVSDWRIMVVRRLPREQFHLLTSVSIPRDLPSFIGNMQTLQGVQLPADSRFLTLRPSLTFRRADDAAGQARSDISASLDLKWRPLPQAVMDAALNPDFSQVALDVPQLAGNSQFALFYPEKRPFFFEAADLLRTPTDAFYTRSFTEPRWGLRGTWRGDAWAGTALTLHDRGRGLVLLPQAFGTGAVAQPASDVVAFRARSDDGASTLPSGLQVGAVLAARRYASDAGADLGDNTVLGPDLNWQLGSGWRLRGQWLHARSTAVARAGAAGLQLGPAQEGELLHLRLLHQGERSEFNVAVHDIDRDFRHDSGFVNQAGVRKWHGWGAFAWYGLGPFNEFWVNAEWDRVVDKTSGQLVSESLRPGVWVSGAHNLEWWLELYGHTRQRTAAGQPLLKERYVLTGLVITPARWFPLLDTKLVLGELADTQANRVRPGGNFRLNTKLRPLARLEFESTATTAWLRSGGQRSYSETAVQWLAVWHFNARHNLRAIVEQTSLRREAELAVAAQRDLHRSTSLTYGWRASSGTLLYAGFSRSEDRLSAGTRRNEWFVKLQLDADDARAAFGRSAAQR